MKYWNIEDEIAGHMKRYEIKDIQDLTKKYKLKINHLASLNYPLSNWLFSLSNYIIRIKEKEILKTEPKRKKNLYWKQRSYAKNKIS